MSDLPTREQIRDRFAAWPDEDVDWPEIPVAKAYRDGDLMTRQELFDSAVKVTTWDFTCNSELTEGYCDACEMDDTVDYGPVVVTRSAAVLGKDTEG